MKKTTLVSLGLAPVLSIGLAAACINVEGQNLDSARRFSYSDADCICGAGGNLTGCFHEKCINGEHGRRASSAGSISATARPGRRSWRSGCGRDWGSI